MKRPGETKRGLIACAELNLPRDVLVSIVKDAAAYIERLEARTRNGRWEEVWCDDCMSYGYLCSECRCNALTKDGTMHDEVLSHFCPHCGAKMDAKEEEQSWRLR